MFAPPPAHPTQEAAEGIRFDFNDGLRIEFPQGGKEYRCVFTDAERGTLLFSMDVKPGARVESVKKFFVRFHLEIYERGRKDAPVFSHTLDLRDREVLVQLPAGALGDTIAWFSQVEAFQRRHGCRLLVSMMPELADLFRGQYPDISFVDRETAEGLHPYATYNLGLFFGGEVDHQPRDFRHGGLHQAAAQILGVPVTNEPPRVDLSAPRRIRGKYAVVAAQASSQCKYWNNPTGWREVVSWLKAQGYRVLCIDRNPDFGQGIVWNHIPFGCEDFTGDRPLQERIDVIKGAKVFVGLSSGLSWLAWCCRVPVVMISGFTEPENEFPCHRVQNNTVCHGCWNDLRCEFDHSDFLWCPRKEKLEDRFECSRAIASSLVIKSIKEALNADRPVRL